MLDLVGLRKYTTVADMCDTLVDRIRDQRGEAAWWWEWERATLCVMDELGTRERVNDYEYKCVKRALDKREGRPLIVVTNLTLSRISAVYDDRIASRLAAGTVIHTTGDDRRLRR